MFALLSLQVFAQVEVTFKSLDGLPITGDFYEADNSKGAILLCHQARYSRGEYIETAKKLKDQGWTCLAIDQRSGDQVNGIENETAKRARNVGKPTTYLDAEQDIVAAVEYLHAKTGMSILIVGSSYSASLVLKVGKSREEVIGIAAFSPGEYFGDELKLGDTIAGMEKPLWVTSSEPEAPAVKDLVSKIDEKYVTQFVPRVEGFHGSKALWDEKDGHKEYWESFDAFLAKF